MVLQTIVVGAGLAGLSAAYELVRAGQEVQVFEARERLGGRVHTVQLNAGQYGDLGAEFVDDNHTALINYATEFEIKLDPACQFPDDLYWYVDGMLRNRESFSAEKQTALENLFEKLQLLIEKQHDPQQTLDEWLETNQQPPFAKWIARLSARSLFATDPELIGVGFFAYFNTLGGSGSNMRLRGGSSRLVDALAKVLGERVHTRTPVRRIQQTENNLVSVSIETANGLVEAKASTVIVAIPWSVLRHIPIVAPFTDSQQDAIFHLPYGSLVKTLLQYPYRFWSKPNFGITLLDAEYQVVWEPSFAQMGTERILSCFSGGSRSVELSENAVDRAIATVRTVYPEAPEIVTSRSYDWSADEWSKGAYCYFRPGDLDRFNPHLMQRAGHIFFAGEHTAPVEYRGYMEGAIRSGQRAAQQVLESVR
ncbi:amine oxidase [Scytonema hofmannii PCC 7110]|uniref:Amine oxidase n=1 Tax=Scytonema hofmannii PCC 7110 TaxID=128403 RepID=A0A139X825_9CYAN|nr:NAD(P)/FAD-dependent oxidoreductase [Scytonema hofmannii]KYC40782.1 amine oxidase [Scytonema hofmannii PCC 7110]